MVEYIELLNPAMVVERIAGETPPRYAVREPWGPRYDQLLVKFEKLLAERDTWQGKRYSVNGEIGYWMLDTGCWILDVTGC